MTRKIISHLKCVLIVLLNIFASSAIAQSATEPDRKWLEHFAPLRWGTGISANWNAIVGYGIAFEGLNYGPTNTEVAGYCAPVGVIASDVNLGASFNIIKPMGYKIPEDYTGYALSFAVSLPFRIGSVQYSFGGSFNEAIDNLEKQKKYGDFDPTLIPSELGNYIASLVSSKMAVEQRVRIQTIACQIGGITKQGLPQSCANLPAVQFTEKDISFGISPNPSQAKEIDSWVSADFLAMHKFIRDVSAKNVFAKKAPNFNKLFKALVDTIADCGSISIGIGIGTASSLLPVSFSAQLSHYTLVAKGRSIPENFKRLTSLNILQMLSVPQEQMAFNSAMAKQLVTMCADSRRIIGSDLNRLYDVLTKPPDIPEISVALDSYFAIPGQKK